MTLPGMKPITTVDPENVKAILATQFNDFGKGEEFHAAWKYVTDKKSPANCSFSVTEFLMSTVRHGLMLELFCDHNSSNNVYPTFRSSKGISVQ